MLTVVLMRAGRWTLLVVGASSSERARVLPLRFANPKTQRILIFGPELRLRRHSVCYLGRAHVQVNHCIRQVIVPRQKLDANVVSLLLDSKYEPEAQLWRLEL
jgi:hypothetical protein